MCGINGFTGADDGLLSCCWSTRAASVGGGDVVEPEIRRGHVRPDLLEKAA